MPTEPSSIAQIIEPAIRSLLQDKSHVIVAIDGRCASGKTTVAATLAERLHCPVCHMDDFFLRPEQRTPERLAIPGENVDHERFLSEVLQPLADGKPFSYHPYDCRTRSLGDALSVDPTNVSVTLVEGSYACHPSLWPFYDLRIFLDISSEQQAARILARNGAEMAQRFADTWIPLEEAYFDAYDLRSMCDLYISVT